MEIEQIGSNLNKILDTPSSVSIRRKNPNNPFITYLNINSLRNKIHDLRTLVAEISPEVLTISETKLDNSFPDAQFLIDGYQNPHNLRKDRTKNGGGLITFIKKGIPHKRLLDIEPKNLEIICMEITFGKRKWGYVAIYRPPDMNITDFFNDLAKCQEHLINRYDHTIITGDINININDSTSIGYTKYENFLDTFGLSNIIKWDTCFTKRNENHISSSIDIFLTNSPKKHFNTHSVSTGISDVHVLIGSLLKASFHRAPPQEIEYRNYKQLYQNFDNFRNDIKNINISEEDPNRYYDNYTKTFQEILNKHAPLKKKKVRGNDGGFANKTLRNAWYKRSKLRNIYIKNKNENTWQNFKNQRNLCTSLKRKAKKDFFINKTKDRESFWKIFGPFITNKCHHSREDYIILKNGELISDKKEVANLFNDHYIHIIENTTGTKPETFKFDPYIKSIDQIVEVYKEHPSILLIKDKMQHIPDHNIFEIPPCTASDIFQIVKKINIKAAQGYDKIPPKILKMCAHEIADPLSEIINFSLKHGTFVDSAKISICTPVYKNPANGSRQNIPLYRPLNICTSFSKILERYNLNSMIDHTNKILSKHITAYRKGHSCQQVLLKLTEDWRKLLDENKIAAGVLMDLSKAFDCLPHELLIAKLHAYGFSENTLSTLYSYLKKRKQAVNINGVWSEFLEILSGVPQGSILGPILFNIFINDFIYHIENTPTDVYNFADDNTLTAFAERINDIKIKLEHGGSEALKWLEANNMIANPDKFKFIVVKKPSQKLEDITINIGDHKINSSTNVDLLGLNIDEHLNFRNQIKNMCSKAGAKLNAIKRLTNSLKQCDRKLLVNAHVISQFNYSSIVWHCCGLTEIHKMEKLHERCIRFIYDEYNKNYFEILIENKLTTLYGKRMLAMCCEIFCTKNGLNAGYMKDLFKERPSKYPSRHPDNLFVPKANQVTYGYKSIRIQGPKIWNSLPNEIKEIKSLPKFKEMIANVQMPFCSCKKCLSLQIKSISDLPIINAMMRDILAKD